MLSGFGINFCCNLLFKQHKERLMHGRKIFNHTPPLFNTKYNNIKHFLLILLFLIFTISGLSALSGEFAGLGVEGNANTREGAAIGGNLSLGVNLNDQFSLGIKTVFSYDTSAVSTLEPAAFFRYYLPLKINGLFAQAELGASFFFEDGNNYPAFQGGLAFGWHYNLFKNWYIEPYVRLGYPFVWGAGFLAGFHFDFK
jgi:hypothetical protein